MSESECSQDAPKATPRGMALPSEPTSARPGSEEKVEVLRARYLRGEALFHPLDCDVPLPPRHYHQGHPCAQTDQQYR